MIDLMGRPKLVQYLDSMKTYKDKLWLSKAPLEIPALLLVKYPHYN